MNQQFLAYGAQNRQAALIQLRQESEMVNQEIAQYDQQLNALNYPGAGGLVQQQKNQLSQQRNQLVTAHNQMVNQINTLQELAKNPDQDPSLQLNAEVAQSREKYMQAVLDLRKSVDDITAKYEGWPRILMSPRRWRRFHVDQDQAQTGPVEGTSGSDQGAGEGREIGTQREHPAAQGGRRFPSLRDFEQDSREDDLRHGCQLHDHLGRAGQEDRLEAGADDAPIELTTADGTVIKTRKMTILSMRVGKFTIANVECAVMPDNKGDVDPLLGQSFLKHFKVDFSPETGKLSLKRIDTEEAGSSSLDGTASTRPASRAASKSHRTRPQPKATTKAKTKARREGSPT